MNKKPTPRNLSRPWTEKEDDYLQTRYGNTDNHIIAKSLRRTPRAINARASKLNIKKLNHYWTKEQKKFLLDNFNYLTYDELAEKLGRTRWSVVYMAQKLIHNKKHK